MGYVINSAIAYPAENSKHLVSKSSPYVELKGWATGCQAKGTPVNKVEISIDGGQTWKEAEITHRENKDHTKFKVFTWVFWHYKVDVSNLDPKEKVTAMVRAWDIEGNT